MHHLAGTPGSTVFRSQHTYITDGMVVDFGVLKLRTATPISICYEGVIVNGNVYCIVSIGLNLVPYFVRLWAGARASDVPSDWRICRNVSSRNMFECNADCSVYSRSAMEFEYGNSSIFLCFVREYWVLQFLSLKVLFACAKFDTNCVVHRRIFNLGSRLCWDYVPYWWIL